MSTSSKCIKCVISFETVQYLIHWLKCDFNNYKLSLFDFQSIFLNDLLACRIYHSISIYYFSVIFNTYESCCGNWSQISMWIVCSCVSCDVYDTIVQKDLPKYPHQRTRSYDHFPIFQIRASSHLEERHLTIISIWNLQAGCTDSTIVLKSADILTMVSFRYQISRLCDLTRSGVLPLRISYHSKIRVAQEKYEGLWTVSFSFVPFYAITPISLLCRNIFYNPIHWHRYHLTLKWDVIVMYGRFVYQKMENVIQENNEFYLVLFQML